MKLFFPHIIYILRARYVFGISGAVPRVWGRKRAKREEDGFSGVWRAVLLNLTMKYNSCHQRSTTPVVNEVLLLFLHHIFWVCANQTPLPVIFRHPFHAETGAIWLAGKPFPYPRPTNRTKNLHMLGKTPNFVLNLL